MLIIKEDLDQPTWNKHLASCVNMNIFSTYEWGEFRAGGWQVKRYAFFKENHFVGLIQVFIKKIGPFLLGWSSSGICLLDVENFSDIVTALSSKVDLKKSLLRINFFDSSLGKSHYYIDSCQMKKAMNSINSSYTVRFDLTKFKNDPKTYSSNNRYYLNKAIKGGLTFSLQDFDYTQFVKTHKEMATVKNMDSLIVSEEEMAKLARIFKEHVKMCSVYSTDGSEILSSAAVLIFENQAYYFLAGGTERGRKEYASFLMVHELINYLTKSGVREFDFGGITPFNSKAAGVDRFKIGFGGDIIRYTGEYDLTLSSILRFGFNFLLKIKKIG